MARKHKQEEAPQGAPAWTTTFADLMNLLLCFFVLLFSMSNVDAQKYEQVIQSFASTFSIFDNGGATIGDGQLIGAGMSQLSELDEYYTTIGKTENGVETEDGENEPKTEEEIQNEEVREAYKGQLRETTEVIYDNVSDLTDKYNLNDYVNLSMDSEYTYVQLSLNGSILYDSGKAMIKESALPILSRIGDVLGNYSDFMIEIEGHTDTVPIKNSEYKSNYWLSAARALNASEYLIDVKGLNPSNIKASGRGEYEPVASNKTDEGRRKNRRIEIKIYNSLVK